MFSDDVAKQFDPVPGYCNTASVGIPPRAAVEVLRDCLDAWAGGILDKAGFDADVARARDGFARLAGAPVATVAMPGAVSITSGLVASCLPEGSRVLCAEEDFTSVLFPFLVDPRLDVTVVPLDELLDQLGPAVDLVAASAVRIRGHRCTARLYALPRMRAGSASRRPGSTWPRPPRPWRPCWPSAWTVSTAITWSWPTDAAGHWTFPTATAPSSG
jgi:hypothetical protein